MAALGELRASRVLRALNPLQVFSGRTASLALLSSAERLFGSVSHVGRDGESGASDEAAARAHGRRALPEQEGRRGPPSQTPGPAAEARSY